MSKPKYHPNAETLITDYINNLPEFSKEICQQLRTIILATDNSIIEDWKWGPNYNRNGMVCGFGAFQKHVNLVFFQGAILTDKQNILIANLGNIHNRHIRFTDASQIKTSIIKAYINEAIQNNLQGLKVESADKEIQLPVPLLSILKSNNLLTKFEKLTYYKRKEFINWYLAAKRDDTQTKRLIKIVDMVANDSFLY